MEKRASSRKTKKTSTTKLSKLKSEILSKLNRLIKTDDTESNETSDDNISYTITPKGILWCIMKEVYGINSDVSQLDSFSEKFLSSLSNLATDGKNSELFGNDINEFFKSYIYTMNMCGEMAALLKENGIELPKFDDGEDK